MTTILLAAYEAAVAACDPEAAVRRALAVDGDDIVVGGHRFRDASVDDVVIVALGKAAPAMVRGAAGVFGTLRGVAVSNHTEECPVPLSLGAHPVPDSSSLACGAHLLEFVRGLAPGDLVVYLISGGGSAIAVAPVDGVDLTDLAAMNDVMMGAGVPIGEMNEVRAAVSKLKGGGLSNVCPARRVVTLILSDVVGAEPTHVASGPSIGAGMGSEASAVMDRHGLSSRMPVAIADAVQRWSPPEERMPHLFTVIGSSSVAANAAASYLASVGIASTIVTSELMGEARTEAVDLVRGCAPGRVTIAAGETTVTVHGDGIGGRNQEAALTAAIEISDTNIVFAALGTDGIDGPTPAAGAIVDGATAQKARALGVDLEAALENNDSYTALTAVEATVVRGDTGTNVGDLWLVSAI